MAKVEAHGIRGNYSRWIRNWLTGRTQRVVIHDQACDPALVTSGVPQGSVLGPLLFIIYDDLDVGIISKINKFADDTKLCRRAFTERDRATIQSDLNRLLQWIETWQTSFNIEKCSVMHVGANIPIKTVQQQRDSGVIITENLKHDKQVEKSVKNASRIHGFIARNFEYKGGGERERERAGVFKKKVNENCRKLMNFCEGNEFEDLNVTIGNGLQTCESKEWKAAIGYVLVNHEARQHIREMYVNENEFDVDTEPNGNANDMNKEMAKMLPQTTRPRWLKKEQIKKERMRRKIFNKKQRQMRNCLEDIGLQKWNVKVKRVRFDEKATLPVLGFVPINKPILTASSEAAYLIANQGKPHTIGETLVKPAVLKMENIMLGKEAEIKLSQIPLSKDTISDRIEDVSEDILAQVVADLISSPEKFSLQPDETIDVFNLSQAAVCVRYVRNDAIKEHCLFCKPLEQQLRQPM
ncbi:Reverse transcriptase domain [Trinorchestia longiramus]|nr:Reverse transcriptase domain [Trinorchestia longiramus]